MLSLATLWLSDGTFDSALRAAVKLPKKGVG